VRDELYPAIEPYKTDYLNLDGLHQMYWEESGNPEGIPVEGLVQERPLLLAVFLIPLIIVLSSMTNGALENPFLTGN
jgi:hypothetical protein